MWPITGRPPLSFSKNRGLVTLCPCFSVLKGSPEGRGHSDHDEQFGEGLGEYGGAHEVC